MALGVMHERFVCEASHNSVAGDRNYNGADIRSLRHQSQALDTAAEARRILSKESGIASSTWSIPTIKYYFILT